MNTLDEIVTDLDMLAKVKDKLEIDSETTIYDSDLKSNIKSSMIKLKAEGIRFPTKESEWLDMYLTCVAYNCSINLFIDADYEPLKKRYVNNVVTLRLLLGADY